MTITELIAFHGGSRAFRKKLSAKGLKIPASTLCGWITTGHCHYEPPAYIVECLATMLRVGRPRKDAKGKGKAVKT